MDESTAKPANSLLHFTGQTKAAMAKEAFSLIITTFSIGAKHYLFLGSDNNHTVADVASHGPE
jgi:hypothetical protein